MAAQGIECVVVTGDEADGSTGWGVVSDLDLVAAASVRELDQQTAAVGATAPTVTIGPRDSIKHAGRLMVAHGVSYLVVVEPLSGRPVGVVTALDLARALAGDQKALGPGSVVGARPASFPNTRAGARPEAGQGVAQ
jgi:CBS domain-containing protein